MWAEIKGDEKQLIYLEWPELKYGVCWSESLIGLGQIFVNNFLNNRQLFEAVE